jgi:hypothetical protein
VINVPSVDGSYASGINRRSWQTCRTGFCTVFHTTPIRLRCGGCDLSRLPVRCDSCVISPRNLQARPQDPKFAADLTELKD